MAKRKAVFTLPMPPENALDITRGWLKLGVGALALAGLFAILLVLARTPFFQQHLPWIDFFHTALIVHVNLSVLVWVMAITSLLWHWLSHAMFPMLSRTTLWLCVAGTVLIALAAFTPNANPLLNNYVPVLQNITFFTGLSLFACGMLFGSALTIGTFFAAVRSGHAYEKPLALGVFLSGLIIAMALLCFVLSYQRTIAPDVFEVLDAQQFYEHVFWGGGHVLQLSYTLMMMVAWLWMAEKMKLRHLPSARLVTVLFCLHAFMALLSPLAYRYEILSFEHINFFTQQMRHGGGLASIIIMAFLVAGLLRRGVKKKHQHLYNALLWSVMLYAMGGFLGYVISGSNVIIPAHYHGSIVGVTLALMGLVYLLLPKLGYKHLNLRLARLQPVIYGLGQLMHVVGFAISGGYGTLRKTPGAAQTAEGQAALGLMGFGGLLSVVGGLLFVLAVYQALQKKNR